MQLQIHENEEPPCPKTFGLYFRDDAEQGGNPGSSTVALVDKKGFGVLCYLDARGHMVSIRTLGHWPGSFSWRALCWSFRRLAPGSSVTITAGKDAAKPRPDYLRQVK